MNAYLICALLTSMALLASCDIESSRHDAIVKTENSILQKYVSDLEGVSHSKDYFAYPNALGSGQTVLAFPLQGTDSGYVAVLAKSKTPGEIRQIPESYFVVSRTALAAIRESVPLDQKVSDYLADHVR